MFLLVAYPVACVAAVALDVLMRHKGWGAISRVPRRTALLFVFAELAYFTLLYFGLARGPGSLALLGAVLMAASGFALSRLGRRATH